MNDTILILKLCRTCLVETHASNAHSIFENNVWSMLTECLSLQIDQNDNLSKIICSTCQTFLVSLAKFKETSIQCETKIREYLNGKHEEKLDDEKYVDLFTYIQNVQTESSDDVKPEAVEVKLEPVGLNVLSEDEDSSRPSTPPKRKRRVKNVFKQEISGDERDYEPDANETDSSYENESKKIKKNATRVVDEEKSKFSCTICQRKFTTRGALERHGITHEREIVTCPVCKHAFSNKFSMYQHMKRHGEANFPCPKDGCGKKYFFLDKLVTHLRSGHRVKPTVTCAYCPEKFIVKQQLDYHLKKNYYHALERTKKEPYMCPNSNCDQRLYSLYHMAVHVAKKHKYSKSLECAICKCRFHLTEQLLKHEPFCRERHDTKDPITYECPEKTCSRKYSEIHQLALHATRKHGYSRSHGCTWCGATFCFQVELDRHIQEEDHVNDGGETVDTQIKPGGLQAVLCQTCGKYVRQISKHMREHSQEAGGFKCQTCAEIFATKKQLQTHTRNAHVDDKICHVCGITYKSQKHLLSHEKDAKKTTEMDDVKPPVIRNVPCDICNKMFQSKTRMSEHRSLVHHPKKVECPVCQRIYPKKALKRHILLVHQEQRNFPCSVCAYKCKTDAHLKTHMRQHTDERPHPCPHCSQAFRQRTTLQNHIKRHTGEKPHACKICHKRFIQRHAMLTHLKTHQGDRVPYVCRYCDRTFAQTSALNAHMMTHLEHANGSRSPDGILGLSGIGQSIAQVSY